MGNQQRFGICDSRVTRDNRRAVEEFARLATKSSHTKLKPGEVKRFARLQTQLMKTGVVVPLTREIVKEQARAVYAAMSWRHKLGLRVRYYLRALVARFEFLKIRLRLRP